MHPRRLLRSLAYNLGLRLYTAWLLKLIVSRNVKIIPEINSDNIWEKPDIVFPFIFYEQLKLPFLTYLTEGVVSRTGVNFM